MKREWQNRVSCCQNTVSVEGYVICILASATMWLLEKKNYCRAFGCY